MVALNKILILLNGGGVKAVADDILLIVSELFLSTISEIMEKVLRMLHQGAANKGLGVKRSKAELMLFIN